MTVGARLRVGVQVTVARVRVRVRVPTRGQVHLPVYLLLGHAPLRYMEDAVVRRAHPIVHATYRRVVGEVLFRLDWARG